MAGVTLTLAQALERAFSAYQAGRLAEAEQLCESIIAVTDHSFDAFHILAVVQSRLGKGEAALKNCDRAIGLRPDHAEALNNRGNVLRQLGRPDEALGSYDRVLALQPANAEALNMRGIALQELKRFEEALASYDRAIGVRPDFSDAHYNRGVALTELKRPGDALESYDRALAARPDHALALINRGNTLKELKRFDEALASYDRALAVRPDYAEAFNNRGNALKEMHRLDEASASYDRAIAVRPDHAEAHYNQALLRLLLGDFDRGWAEYEWRWRTDFVRKGKPSLTQPPWLGRESISGKTILLHTEQGYGDAIQFCRYAPLVAARGARVLLGVRKSLYRLMTTLAGTSQVLAEGDPLPHFDFHCPLLSLPLVFATRPNSIPATIPYLHAPAAAAAGWSEILQSRKRPRIGVAWSGHSYPDPRRSIELRALLPLLESDATFVSLQKDISADDAAVLKDHCEILAAAEQLNDFADTAALVSNLDLVISIDTGVAHLAGALAKPLWVLLPFLPDWRWLLGRDDSPWYPTARLFRQDETRSWDSVIARVRMSLRAFVSER